MDKANAPTIAVLNGTTDILEMVQEILRAEGYNTVTALISDFKRGHRDFVEFIKTTDPAVVIYDVPPPYDLNMTFLHLLRDTHVMDDRCILLTTTNTKALSEITGDKTALEIMGKPYDLNQLLNAVREKVAVCAKAA